MILLSTFFTTWKILGFISIILLFAFWKSKNAVWGGLIIGTVIGLISSIFRQGGFDWHFVAKFAIVGSFIGVVADLLGKLSDRLKKKRK
jgi:hypothetical protein